MSTTTDLKFAAIYAEALAAGAAAGAAISPTPMVVEGHSNPLDGSSPIVKRYLVPDGVCGFGWVAMKGNTAFAKWAKKNGHARPGYPSGLHIWSKLMTQSLARNEAWANAVAAVLTKHGITAYGQSRID